MNNYNNISINQFQLSSGALLENINIAFKTYGNLNSDKSNAVLICHSLSSNAHVCSDSTNEKPGWWEYIVGPGKYIDTNTYFVICVNNLGGCFGSTGPNSINPQTGVKYGKNFPSITINEMVKTHKHVLDHLEIDSLHAVVGSSMGGIIALEWAIAFPEMVKRMISISSCAVPPASVIASHEIQRNILATHDCDENCDTCQETFKIARKVGLITYKCADNLNKRFKENNRAIESYLDYNSEKFTNDFNRDSYLIFLNAMDDYTIKDEPSSYGRIAAKSLIISVDTDVLFPKEAQVELYNQLRKFNQRSYLINHSSPHGHDAFFKDEIIGGHIKRFLAEPLEKKVSQTFAGGILSTIGKTPLVPLTKIKEYYDLNFNIYAKLEAFNPGGSIKDRPAKEILMDALENGLINSDTTVIEYSSGNMGIGLSQACCYLGLKFICVCDTKTTDKTKQIMEAYGTKIIQIKDPDPATNEFLPAAYEKIKQLTRMIPNCFWVNQHGNLANAKAHYHTFREIHHQLERVDFLFCATSTCGTIRGCGEYIRANRLKTKIIAVDALGSSIFSNNKQKRIIPGHGAGLVPAIMNRDLIDEVMFATAEQSVFGARQLLACEAILAGGSTGAVLSAIIDYRKFISPGSHCVMIAPDRGERYLDTIYNDVWCLNNNINIHDMRAASNE